ncbi:MAG: proprotein convertase P-domain-containing protein, partial [Myxococcota bacterium]|nr:proprotein convertase P-domain-containing protein [Myxococcota bacterium]
MSKRRLLFSALAIGLGLTPLSASADVPQQIHYQGYLTDDAGNPIHCPSAEDCPSGAVTITFRLYDQASGGDVLWLETVENIPAIQGVVDLTLGQVTPITPEALQIEQAWLGLDVNGSGELEPRQAIVSSAYAVWSARSYIALSAETAETANTALSAETANTALSAETALVAEDSQALGGQLAEAYVTVDGIGGLCVTEDELDAVLLEAAYLDEIALATYLTENGYVSGDTLDETAVLDIVLGAGFVPGDHFSGNWAQLTDVPEDLLDGDADTLAGMNCDEGEVAIWNGAAWECGQSSDVVGDLDCDPGEVPTWDGDGWGCGSATIAPNMLDDVSNGLLSNEFDDTYASGGGAVAITDFNPLGVSSEILVPDVGLAQTLTVSIHVENSDFETVTITLFDPENSEYTLHAETPLAGGALVASYPDPTPSVSGDLTDWEGKNPAGVWRLHVVDLGFQNIPTDGSIVSWDVQVNTLSNEKVQVQGDLIIEGQVQGNLDTEGAVAAGTVRVKPADVPPIACSPEAAGTLWYDTAVQGLRLCNGQD